MSCAQRSGVPGRKEGDADAPGHVLGREQQAEIPAAVGTAPRLPPPYPSCCNADRDLRSAQTISGCLLSSFTSHAGCFSPTHLLLHLLHLSHSLTSSEKNNPLEIDAIPKSWC